MELIFLLDDVPCPMSSLQDNIFIPLNQTAMDLVLRNNLTYICIEDFFDYNFALKEKQRIRDVMQDMLDKLDKYIGEKLSNEYLLKFGPFNLYCWNIVRQIQNYMMYQAIFEKIISKYSPDKITFRHATLHSTFEIIAPHEQYCFLLQAITVKRGIFFDNIVASKKEMPASISSSFKNNIVEKIKEKLKKVPIISQMYEDIKNGISRSDLRQNAKINGVACFLQTGWGIYYYRQYFKKIILKVPLFWIEKRTNPKILAPETIHEIISNEINKLINIWGANPTHIMLEVLNKALKTVFTSIDVANAYFEFFKKNKIEFIFYTNLSTQMLPALMAAKWLGIKTVCKNHGGTLFDIVQWFTYELKPCSIYFSEYDNFSYYMQSNADKLLYKTICKTDSVRKLQINEKKARNKLVYIPTFFTDYCNSYDFAQMFSPEYYRIQRAILEVLNESEKYEIVYKCYPSRPDYHFPVQKFIEDNCKNIRISYSSLKTECQDCFCILLDSPSSSMFDAILLNVPFQILTQRKLHLRESAVHEFKDFITIFDSENDIPEKVKEILLGFKFKRANRNELGFKKLAPNELLALFRTTV